MLEKINHPNIPKIVDLLEDENNIYIIESYVEGTVLSEKIRSEGKIDIDTALKYFIELSELIEYLHNVKPNPIIYRDLKPNNIIVSYNNRLVLVDFSISKFDGESEKTVIAGNKYFSSPEQMTLNEHSDTRSDIYSLGMIALRMITGNLNQTIDYSLSKYVEIPAGLKEIIEKCINYNQEDRYQEASDLLDDLLAFRESYNQVSVSKKKIVLIEGASNTGKTFIAANLAKHYASKKVKTTLVDLSNEIGCGEYIDICIDGNIADAMSQDKLSDIRKRSYKKGKYLEVYKGQVKSEDDLISFLNKISKQSDLIIIDSTSFEPIKLYDYVDETILVTTQDCKAEALTNKIIVNYISKKVDLNDVKIVVNRYIDGDVGMGEILDNLNQVPKIFKSDVYFKKITRISEAKRIEILNETKIRSMNIV
ncbi:MAG: protein kinase [Clostridia bacterium]|nr:protein kinase [Clostridia bacterium]